MTRHEALILSFGDIIYKLLRYEQGNQADVCFMLVIFLVLSSCSNSNWRWSLSKYQDFKSLLILNVTSFFVKRSINHDSSLWNVPKVNNHLLLLYIYIYLSVDHGLTDHGLTDNTDHPTIYAFSLYFGIFPTHFYTA